MKRVAILATLSGAFCSFSPFAYGDMTNRGRSTSPWALGLTLGSGLGQYQDVQVPENIYRRTRGDGTAIGRENDTHTGIPVELNAVLGYSLRPLSFFIRGGLVHVAAFTAPWETSTARYQRLELVLGTKYSLPVTAVASRFQLGLDISRRRTSFLNGSTGHYIDAYAPGLQLGLTYKSYLKLQAGFRSAVSSVLGFQAESADLSGEFREAETSLAEWHLQTSYRIIPGSWIVLKFQSEQVRATISDLNQYQEFGLAVESEGVQQPHRDYVLTTNILSIGFEKYF